MPRGAGDGSSTSTEDLHELHHLSYWGAVELVESAAAPVLVGNRYRVPPTRILRRSTPGHPPCSSAGECARSPGRGAASLLAASAGAAASSSPGGAAALLAVELTAGLGVVRLRRPAAAAVVGLPGPAVEVAVRRGAAPAAAPGRPRRRRDRVLLLRRLLGPPGAAPGSILSPLRAGPPRRGRAPLRLSAT